MKLSMIVFALVFMACSCDPDPIVPDPVEITTSDLVGDWSFQSLEFNGDFYTDCDYDLNLDYNYVTLNFYDVTTTTMVLYSNCVDGDEPDDREYPYTLSNNIINCNNGSRVFEIMNVETFDGSELVVKFISATTTGVPINGVYTLIKD